MAFNFNVLKAHKEVKALTEQVTALTADNKSLLEVIEAYKQKEAAFSLGSQDYAAEKEILIKTHSEAMAEVKTNLDTTIAKLTSDNTANIDKITKEYTDKVNALEVQLVEVKCSVNRQAANLVNALGIAPDSIRVQVTPTDNEIFEQFNKMQNGPERTAFYNANKNLILKATGLIK